MIKRDKIPMEAGITALYMDDKNDEGIIGTTNGDIYYINLADQTQLNPDKKFEAAKIRLVTRVAPSLEVVQTLRSDPSNSEVVYSSCGINSDDIRLYTTDTMDQIINWPTEQASPVRFVLGCNGKQASQRSKKYRIIGHANGLIRFLQLDKLEIYMQFYIPLELDEELTAGAYSFYDNFTVGTSHGNVFFGNMNADDKTFKSKSYLQC